MNPQRCCEILEIPVHADLEAATQAYQRLKRIHGGEASAVSAPFMDEFGPEARARVLAEIEDAYRELSLLQAPAKASAPVASQALELERPLDGPALRRAREAAGLNLEQVASETHVRIDYLEALESERFRELPAGAVYIRGYLMSFLRVLGVPSDEAATEYMARYRKVMGSVSV